MLGAARKEIEELEAGLRLVDSRLTNKRAKYAAITEEIREVIQTQDQVASAIFP